MSARPRRAPAVGARLLVLVALVVLSDASDETRDHAQGSVTPPTEPPIGAASAGGADRPPAADPGGPDTTAAAGFVLLALVSLGLTGISAAAVRRSLHAWRSIDAFGATGFHPPAGPPTASFSLVVAAVPVVPAVVGLVVDAAALSDLGRTSGEPARARDQLRLVAGAVPYRALLAVAAVRAVAAASSAVLAPEVGVSTTGSGARTPTASSSCPPGGERPRPLSPWPS
jgi:hypothetical protein